MQAGRQRGLRLPIEADPHVLEE
eukprot:COSAG03_NODE_11464_length_591_cov_0.859756_2_plen_22_part_01